MQSDVFLPALSPDLSLWFNRHKPLRLSEKSRLKQPYLLTPTDRIVLHVNFTDLWMLSAGLGRGGVGEERVRRGQMC